MLPLLANHLYAFFRSRFSKMQKWSRLTVSPQPRISRTSMIRFLRLSLWRPEKSKRKSRTWTYWIMSILSSATRPKNEEATDGDTHRWKEDDPQQSNICHWGAIFFGSFCNCNIYSTILLSYYRVDLFKLAGASKRLQHSYHGDQPLSALLQTQHLMQLASRKILVVPNTLLQNFRNIAETRLLSIPEYFLFQAVLQWLKKKLRHPRSEVQPPFEIYQARVNSVAMFRGLMISVWSQSQPSVFLCSLVM